MTSTLSVRELSVNYGHVAAVRCASFDVAEGELIAIVGSNGAGKTSLLHAVAGVVKPAGGVVTLGEDRLTGRTPERVVSAGVALVPEGRRIFSGLTITENLRLASPDGAGIDGILDRFPALASRSSQRAGVLSGGEAQQLAIARALLAEPTILLLDEPSLGLSPVMIDVVFELIAELRSDGLGIVLVEQHATRAMAIADRSHLMRHGSLESIDGDGGADFFRTYLGVDRARS
jgi:branched-chain amino acid transport system ATP-binding protein